MGHKQTINMIKIDKIEHAIDESDFTNQLPENLTVMKHPTETSNRHLF